MKKILFGIALLSFLGLTQTVSAHETLPAQFKKVTVAQGLTEPTALAQTPDGRIFVLERAGSVRIVKDGQLLPTPLVTVGATNEGEQGLLGIAIDPGFASNHTIYLDYVNNNPREIRISKFIVNGDSAGSETVLFHTTDTLQIMHKAGTLRVGPDGKLWFTIGNNGDPQNSQNLSNVHGKLLRINKDGSIPSDNPFYNQAGKEGRIWAYGFRNPFRFSFWGNTPIIGDVGESSFEEIDLGVKGGNFGFPLDKEGSCTNCPYVKPLFYYPHNGQSSSVTGGLVYTGTAFPKDYQGSYFYGDYAKGFIRRISFDSSNNFVADNEFDDEAGSVVDMMQSSDGDMYYVTIYPGALYKLTTSNTDLPPSVKITATPQAGLAPLTVHFSSEGSTDPENKPLTYSWNFGDGSAASTVANPDHTYTQNGTYTAALTVSDGVNQSSLISFPIIVGDKPPVVSIDTPVAEKLYAAGETISYSGSATDPEDGTLPADKFSWTIIFHHQTHIHPFLGPLIGTASGTFTIPASGEPSVETWYELKLTVTDSKGATTTVIREIHPKVVTVGVASRPDVGFTFTWDGAPQTTPFTTRSVVGYKHTVDLQTPQNLNGTQYDFASWSDGGAKTHDITTPDKNTGYIINLTSAGQGVGKIKYRVREFDDKGNWTGKFLNGATAKLTDPSGVTFYAATTSAVLNGQDGWVAFDNVPSGTYALLSYKETYTGYWKQTTCAGAGTTTDASIINVNTKPYTASWQNTVKVSDNSVSWCMDVGLKPVPQIGNLEIRVMRVAQTASGNYDPIEGINGATVKVTDSTGTTVIQTATSHQSGSEAGWTDLLNVPSGVHGLMAYKAGYTGFWRQTDCQWTREINASIKNSNTEGQTAAWNPNVPVTAGTTTYCYDLGLLQGNGPPSSAGSLRFRIREVDAAGQLTGAYINGATVKLTDTTGNTVVATSSSQLQNGSEDGWVFFETMPSGNYGAMAYKDGYKGLWKQTSCDGLATIDNATIQNGNTEGHIAGWQNNLSITTGVTWCADIGLTKGTVAGSGNLYFRVREIDANGNWTGKFINGATAKLLDSTGAVVATKTSSVQNTDQDGWVFFDGVSSGTYSTVVYKAGMEGAWRQTTCDGQGTADNATVTNATTENTSAATQTGLVIRNNETTWCQDVGLKAPGSNPTPPPANTGRIMFRVRDLDASGTWGGKFINDATAVLASEDMTQSKKTATSAVLNGEDGWVILDTDPGSYSVLTYKDGKTGAWKQTSCEGAGTTDDATVSNSLTTGHTAAKQGSVVVTAGTTTWCRDVGLE